MISGHLRRLFLFVAVFSGSDWRRLTTVSRFKKKVNFDLAKASVSVVFIKVKKGLLHAAKPFGWSFERCEGQMSNAHALAISTSYSIHPE